MLNKSVKIKPIIKNKWHTSGHTIQNEEGENHYGNLVEMHFIAINRRNGEQFDSVWRSHLSVEPRMRKMKC